MTKWLLLALGLFLLVNGSFARTFSFQNPEEHCFRMDWINVGGCFGNPAIPQLATWGTLLAGACIILGLALWARAQRVQARHNSRPR